MRQAVESGSSAIEELRALAAEIKQELAPQEAELRELAVLIKQTAAEIDRLTPQRNDINKRIREMEGNIEHYSRSDIAQGYATSQETQMRLFMMQTHREQLEYKQRTLERNRRNFLRFVALAEQLPAGDLDGGASDEGSASSAEVRMRIAQAIDDERKRAARLVHDLGAQPLSNLVIRGQLCERLLDTDEDRARVELRTLHEAMAVALQETRRLIYELHPLDLEDLRLRSIIEKYVQSVGDRLTIPVQLEVTGVEQHLEHWAEMALFRLVQEALSNAARHAKAKNIRVVVNCTEEVFEAMVEDDGIGFQPPTSAREARQKRWLGILGMLDRAALLGGTITINSAPGHGTRIVVRVPLGAEEETEEQSLLSSD